MKPAAWSDPDARRLLLDTGALRPHGGTFTRSGRELARIAEAMNVARARLA
jgi:hypothetical protein